MGGQIKKIIQPRPHLSAMTTAFCLSRSESTERALIRVSLEERPGPCTLHPTSNVPSSKSNEYDIYYMLSEKRLTLDGFATGISESTIFVMRQMLCFEDQDKVLFRVQDSTGAGGLPGHPPGEAPERIKLGVLSKHHSVFSSNSDRNAQKIRPLYASERQRSFYDRSYLRRRV